VKKSTPVKKESASAKGAAVKWVSAGMALIVAGLIAWGLLVSRPAVGTSGAGGVSVPDFYGLAGQVAPNFTLKDVTNTPVSLSDFRGRRVLVNFWYAACPGCLQEMAAFEQFATQKQSQPVVILAVNIVDDAQTAARFMRQLGITFPVVLDTRQQVLDLYKITSTPSSIFVDSRGIIRGSISGPLNQDQLQSYFSVIH